MKYDLIIVSKSTPELKKFTLQTITTARQDKADLNVIIVETSGKKVDYPGAEIVMYKGQFNYNRALNLGLAKAKGDIHILANSDLVFCKGWSQIGQQMKINGFDSASALSEDRRQSAFKRGDWIYPGYEIGIHLTGWCIFVTKECIKKLGSLDETFEFWYSDNVYADQLQANNLRHGLFCNVQVNHVTSVTVRTAPAADQRRYTREATTRYSKLKKLRNVG